MEKGKWGVFLDYFLKVCAAAKDRQRKIPTNEAGTNEQDTSEKWDSGSAKS